jgi:hypothetical protein
MRVVLLLTLTLLSLTDAQVQKTSRNNTIVIMSVGLLDNGGNHVFHGCDPQCIRSTMAGDVSRVFAASSNGAFGFAAPTVWKVPLPAPSALWSPFCGMGNKWYQAAVAAVGGSHVLRQFTVRVFLFSPQAGAGTCTEGGFSTLGCTASDCHVFLRGFTTNLVVHELGHVLGFTHALATQDVLAVIGRGRDSNSGGNNSPMDDSDPMTSQGTVRTFSMPNRLRAGWAKCEYVKNSTTVFSFPASVAAPRQLLSASAPASASTLAPTAWCRQVRSGLLIVSGRTAQGIDPAWAPAVYLHLQNVTSGQSTLVSIARGNETAAFDSVTVTLLRVDPASGIMAVTFGQCQKNGPRATAVAVAVPGVPNAAKVILTWTNADVRCPGRRNVTASLANGLTVAGTCRNITILVTQDNQPSEIAYGVVNADTGVQLLARTNFTSTTKVQQTTVFTCLKEAVDVVFWDTYGDGYCCEWGPGGYQVWVNGVLVQKGGKFGLEDRVRVPALPRWVFPGPVHPGRTVSDTRILFLSTFQDAGKLVLSLGNALVPVQLVQPQPRPLPRDL